MWKRSILRYSEVNPLPGHVLEHGEHLSELRDGVAAHDNLERLRRCRREHESWAVTKPYRASHVDRLEVLRVS